MIEGSRFHEYFPYDVYRKNQKALIDTIEQGARKKANMLLTAPNGTGKTIIALSSLLPVAEEGGLKIIYLCRTHSQSDRVIRELQKINKSKNQEISGLSIRGRTEMCLNSSLKRARVSSTESMAICKNLRKNNKCRYYREFQKIKEDVKEQNLPEFFYTAVNADDLIEYSKMYDYCPYFLAKALMEHMRVIVCNYQWIFNPDIFWGFLRLINLDLERCILVIDECHNIINVATEVNSKSLTPAMVTNFLNDLNKYHFPERYHAFSRILNSYFESLKRRNSGEFEIDPHKILQQFSKKLKLKPSNGFIVFLKGLKLFNKEFRQRLSEEDIIERDNIKPIIAFFEKFLNHVNSESYFYCGNVKKYKKRKYVSLEINALDPREITVSLFRNSFSTLNLTGTVNPSIYSSLTGLNYTFKGKRKALFLSSESPFPSKNILAFITEGISTSKERRNPSMYNRILDYVEVILKNSPANVGIFCASYSVLNSLRMYGIIETVKRSGKKLFMERSGLSTSENALLIEDYKSCGKGNGAVLLGVCGGRNSEGEDFPGDFMTTVIIIGVPYHLPTAKIEAKITYYNKVFNNKGWLYGYLAPAMQRANQASGRPIRKLEDKGVIIFMDERFKDKFRWISEWVRKELKVLPKDNLLILPKILSFFWN